MDSVMVTSHELARLEPGIWLNDTLIDFELKYCFI
jgi:Ulp1 family protease